MRLPNDNVCRGRDTHALDLLSYLLACNCILRSIIVFFLSCGCSPYTHVGVPINNIPLSNSICPPMRPSIPAYPRLTEVLTPQRQPLAWLPELTCLPRAALFSATLLATVSGELVLPRWRTGLPRRPWRSCGRRLGRGGLRAQHGYHSV